LPDDARRMNEASAAALAAGVQQYEQEFRCRDSDGSVRWFQERVHTEPLGPGRWRLAGVITDVTERKLGERSVSALSYGLEALVDASSTLLSSLDVESIVPAVLQLARRTISAGAYAVWRADPARGEWRSI